MPNPHPFQTRKIIPKDMPLFLRISATDWLEEQSDIPESWTVEDTVKLAPLLADAGVDLLDVSTGGNHPKQVSSDPILRGSDLGRTHDSCRELHH